MKRVLEPEIMDDIERAMAYAQADFSASNQWFVDHLLADYPALSGKLVDLGCGPGAVVIRLAKARPTLHVTAVDGSEAMIRLAGEAVRTQGVHEQVVPLCGRLPGLPLQNHSFDAVLSKDLLHHLPDPSLLWSEVSRLARSGAVIYVMDLFRPDTREEAQRLVEHTASQESPIETTQLVGSLSKRFEPPGSPVIIQEVLHPDPDCVRPRFIHPQAARRRQVFRQTVA